MGLLASFLISTQHVLQNAWFEVDCWHFKEIITTKFQHRCFFIIQLVRALAGEHPFRSFDEESPSLAQKVVSAQVLKAKSQSKIILMWDEHADDHHTTWNTRDLQAYRGVTFIIMELPPAELKGTKSRAVIMLLCKKRKGRLSSLSQRWEEKQTQNLKKSNWKKWSSLTCSHLWRKVSHRTGNSF